MFLSRSDLQNYCKGRIRADARTFLRLPIVIPLFAPLPITFSCSFIFIKRLLLFFFPSLVNPPVKNTGITWAATSRPRCERWSISASAAKSIGSIGVTVCRIRYLSSSRYGRRSREAHQITDLHIRDLFLQAHSVKTKSEPDGRLEQGLNVRFIPFCELTPATQRRFLLGRVCPPSRRVVRCSSNSSSLDIPRMSAGV